MDSDGNAATIDGATVAAFRNLGADAASSLEAMAALVVGTPLDAWGGPAHALECMALEVDRLCRDIARA